MFEFIRIGEQHAEKDRNLLPHILQSSISPVEQENDCHLIAKENVLTVVHVDRDIEKYRIKNKLIEPLGLRSEHPGFLAMLHDASRRDFDITLAGMSI